jgi:hypothetical protein
MTAQRGHRIRDARVVACAAALLIAAAGCTPVAQVTTLSDASCRDAIASRLSKILEAQDERPPVAAELAASTTRGLQAYDLGPRPFLVASPSGTDYAFFVQRDGEKCLLRLYGKQKGFVSYTNNLTYIATEPLPTCRCAE